MKYLICSFFFCMSLVMVGQEASSTQVSKEDGINWMTWEEAMKANEKEPRKIFVDIYTEW